jgi:hypothetical protein
VPKNCGLSGKRSPLVLLGGVLGAAAFWAAAAVATTMAKAAAAYRARTGKNLNASDTCKNPLLFKRIGG